MKTNSIYKIITATLLAGTPLFWSACTDAWDDHYGVAEGGIANELSLMENIKADAQLAPFYKILQATGADSRLNAEQQYTVWAPLGLTDAQADSVIAVYQADQADALAKGQKLNWEDNKAISQFLHNQMALYAHPVSSMTDDTITMMNKKYMHLKGVNDHAGTIGGTPFSEVVYSSNGILYKTESMQSFLPNIREFLARTEGMDSITNFIAMFDEVKLDEDASVPGEIIDGKVNYLDSVTSNTNRFLNAFGRIASEDSTYLFIAPTNQVWEELFPKYMKYYNYPQNLLNRDSLQILNARLSIAYGRFFNTSVTNIYNRHPEDSLTNTQYYLNQVHNPRKNVFYKPNETLLSGLDKVTCSNGVVYIDNKTSGVIREAKTFFGKHDYAATRNYEVPVGSDNKETMDVRRTTVYWTFQDGEGNTTKEKSYSLLEVFPKKTSEQSSISYVLPSTLSNVYYNIYVVTHPALDTEYPLQFNASYAVADANGEFEKNSSKQIKYTLYENPNQLTSDDVAPDKTANLKYYYKASTEAVDTILIQSAVKFDVAGGQDGGVDHPVVRLKIDSNGSRNSLNKGTKNPYTNKMTLVEFILVPFETEAEAKEAADKTYLFNDDYLEGKNEGTNDEN